jgi:hypothetical protein
MCAEDLYLAELAPQTTSAIYIYPSVDSTAGIYSTHLSLKVLLPSFFILLFPIISPSCNRKAFRIYT